jgi:hypothetical protein
MSITVDTSLFDTMCRELSTSLKVPYSDVLEAEVGKVLEKAIEDTPAANASAIRAHQESARYSLQPADLYSPRQPGRRKLKNGRVAYNMTFRYPSFLWQEIQKARAVDIAKKIKARGLAKKSWLTIAAKLGLNVKAPGFVTTAVASTGKAYYDDVSGEKTGGAGDISIHIENSQPTINAIGGDEILQKAVDGREQYFVQNIAHGAFDSIDKIVKKYPGIKVS